MISSNFVQKNYNPVFSLQKVSRRVVKGSLTRIRKWEINLIAEKTLITKQLHHMRDSVQVPKQATTCLEETKIELHRQLAQIRNHLQDAGVLEAALSESLRLNPPVSILPSEILEEIFQQGLSLDDHLWDNHLWFKDESRGRVPFILIASHVNHQWRGVAIDNSRFWGNLKISSSQSVTYLDMFLGRSGTCPLDIRVRAGQNWDIVKDKIKPLARRWRLFSGSSFSAFDVDKMVSLLLPLSTPELEVLRIESYDHFMRIRRAPDVLPILEGGAPKLSSLYLLDINLNSCFPPLSSLKSLDLYMYRPGVPLELDEARDVLTASPSLTHLKLASSVMGSVSCRHELPPIKLPSLRTLEVSFDLNCAPDRLICILVALETPILESLVIDRAPSPNIERIISAINGLRSAQDYSALHTLMFWDVDCAKWIDPTFIRIMSAVTFLTIVRSAEDTILRILLEQDTNKDAPLWPDLRTLKVSVFDVELLCNVITDRIDKGRAIQTLTIVHDSEVSKIPQDRIEWLKERIKVDEIYPVVQCNSRAGE